MIPYMKNSMKYIVLLSLVVFIVMSSCAGLREKKAEKHQPFGPHKNKKPQHGHPQDHNHNHPH
jgi:ABC-type nickel/cobalt efflux system permease component RcnA